MQVKAVVPFSLVRFLFGSVARSARRSLTLYSGLGTPREHEGCPGSIHGSPNARGVAAQEPAVHDGKAMDAPEETGLLELEGER